MDELGEIRAALMEAVIKIDALRDAAAEYRKKFDAAGVIGRGERDTAWGKMVDDYNAAGKAMRGAVGANAPKPPSNPPEPFGYIHDGSLFGLSPIFGTRAEADAWGRGFEAGKDALPGSMSHREKAWEKTRDEYRANLDAAAKTPLLFKTEDEARAYNKGVADGHSGAQVPGIAVWYYK